MARGTIETDEADRTINKPEVVEGEAGGSAINKPPALTTQTATCRHVLVWPICFLFMNAYNMAFYTFGQFAYIKLQKEMLPNVTINTTTSHCVEDTDSLNYKLQLEVQQKAATWTIYFYMCGGFTTIFSNFILGSLTDRFGRKFLFIVPCLGTTIRTSLVIVGIYYNFPLYFYLIGCFLESLTGQLFTISQFGYLYVADITPGNRRSVGIVIMDLAFGLGTALPNLVVGYLLKLTNQFIIPFIASDILFGITLLLVLLLPETYPKEIREKRTYTSKLENLKDSADLYFSKKNYGRRWMYIVTFVIFSLTVYDLLGRFAMENLFLMNAPFCWSPEKLGIYGAMKAGLQQIVDMGLVLIFRAFTTDEVIAAVGCVSYGASFVLEAFATTDDMLYIGKKH